MPTPWTVCQAGTRTAVVTMPMMKLYHESGKGIAFGPTCTDGDRMGCGVDFNADYSSGYVSVFFTKNGEQVKKG